MKTKKLGRWLLSALFIILLMEIALLVSGNRVLISENIRSTSSISVTCAMGISDKSSNSSIIFTDEEKAILGSVSV